MWRWEKERLAVREDPGKRDLRMWEALDGLTLYEHKEQRRLLVGRDLLRISIKH